MKRIYYSNDKRTTRQLLAVLKAGNLGERRDAARELAYRDDSSAVIPLIECLADHPEVREQAILSLGILGDKRAIEPLIPLLNNPNYAYNAARALSGIKSRKVVKPLLSGLKSDNRVIRLSAAEVLGGVGDKRAVEHLIAVLNDEDSWVRKYAAVSLGKIRDKRALRPLLRALADTDEEVQAKVIVALGQLGSKSGIRPILEFLKSENRDLVCAAVYALGELRAKVAFEPLLQILNNNNRTNWARQFAAEALGKIGNKQALEPLIGALADEYEVTRIAAADGLGYLGDLRAISALRLANKNDGAVDEFGESVREHAERAIRRIRRLTAQVSAAAGQYRAD